jgi:hypothetical protein
MLRANLLRKSTLSSERSMGEANKIDEAKSRGRRNIMIIPAGESQNYKEHDKEFTYESKSLLSQPVMRLWQILPCMRIMGRKNE